VNLQSLHSPSLLPFYFSLGAMHYVIGQDGKGKLCNGKDETAKEIVKRLEVLCNHITAF
ncbi:phosphopantothenoylcysteine decarboxylase, partial [Bacillus sp. D-CC]